MKRIGILFTIIFIAGSIFAQRDLTVGGINQKRLALVIGNANYQHGGTLRNPVNDADLLVKTLEDLNFTVIKKTDATLREMQLATADFTNKIKDYEVALFFYAGHGIQVDGENYLIPVDAKLDDRTMAKFDAFNISFVNDAFMQNSKNINIMILDACRNDPFRSWSRGGERGFKKIDNSASGTIIAFATQAGSTASDGSGSNGLYTTHLVKQMKINQDIEDVFKNTRIAVNSASKGKQVPQDWSSLMGDFYFTTVTDGNQNNNNTTPNKPVFNPGKTVYGKISFDTKIAGDLYLDNNKLVYVNANTNNNNLEKITVGNHKIKIGDTEKTIKVNENQTTYLKFDLPTLFIDQRDGKTYKIVYIGSQVWMAENLAYKANSGCWAYDNDESNVKYGYFYNWETAKNVCPNGWYLPSEEEFEVLLENTGNNESERYSELIIDGNSGFSAFLTGWGYNNNFNGKGVYSSFWSASRNKEDGAISLSISKDNTNNTVNIVNLWSRSAHFSVRCIKGDENEKASQFIDQRDGKIYKIVYIGNQVWMAENLAYKPSSGTYWAYDNAQSNVSKYGYLYNFETANNVCPSGWHLPSDYEWQELEMYLGMQESDIGIPGNRGTDEGQKLKANYDWKNNGNGTNEYGFTALPSGYRSNHNDDFVEIGNGVAFWSDTKFSTISWSRALLSDNSGVVRVFSNPNSGLSVRCVQDY